MNNEEFITNYHKRQLEEQELTKNSGLIQDFINFCQSKNIPLSKEQFNYVQTIGIVATYPNLVSLLNNKIVPDKEELIELSILESEYLSKPFHPGYLFSEKYMVMGHPYFRRAYFEENNFAPRFIEIFWNYKAGENKKYIAIDLDRVRVDVNDSLYLERDNWFGAKFKNTISDIEDGNVKLRPPLGLEPFHVEFFFGNTYSLYIKWNSKNGIKVFQAEEFKAEKSRIIKNGIEYYPAKYLHAEFDCESKTFRHFDGAIHFYTEQEYFQRRDEDFNFNSKTGKHIKTLSQKLFKVNGSILVEDWVTLVSHYLTGDPLIIEYFEGKLPGYVTEAIEKIMNRQE